MRDFIMNLVARLQVEREDGQAMVEYGLILALVSVVAIVALTAVGTDVQGRVQQHRRRADRRVGTLRRAAATLPPPPKPSNR